LDRKRTSRDKFYDVEKWTQSNPEKLLAEARDNYAQLKNEASQLTDRAMRLKESHESGAIDSINRAYKNSEDAANALIVAENRAMSELRPAVAALEQRLQASQADFEKSDKLLSAYLDGVAGNLSASMQGVFGLNQAVCGGELTNERNKCSAKCGGAVVCGGQCGTNTSSCSGLVDSYWNLVNTRAVFDELYAKQEQTFKKILTKLRGTSNLLNNANKDINGLLTQANNSLNEINAKQRALKEWTDVLLNFTETNREKPAQVRKVRRALF
jgi:ABC-type transporter Mla subunit MlaD